MEIESQTILIEDEDDYFKVSYPKISTTPLDPKKKIKKQEKLEEKKINILNKLFDKVNQKFNEIQEKSIGKYSKKIVANSIRRIMSSDKIEKKINIMIMNLGKDLITNYSVFSKILYQELISNYFQVLSFESNFFSNFSDFTKIKQFINDLLENAGNQNKNEIKVALIFSNIVKISQEQLNDFLKLMKEEILIEKKYEKICFFIYFPTTGNNELQTFFEFRAKIDYFDFVEPKSLFIKFLYFYVKEDFFPIFDKKCLKYLVKYFDYYGDLNFKESIQRIKTIILFFMKDIKNEEVLNCLESAINEKISIEIKDKNFNDFYVDFMNVKTEIKLALNIIEKMNKEILKNNDKAKKIIHYLFSDKEIYQCLNEFATNTDLIDLSLKIGQLIKKYDKRTNIFEKYIEKFNNFDQESEKKLRSGVFRIEIFTSLNEKQKLTELISEFMKINLKNKYINLFREQNKFLNFTINDKIMIEYLKYCNPDIMGNIFKSLTDDPIRETQFLFNIFLKFGNEIEINASFLEYSKLLKEKYHKMDEEDIKNSFYFAIKELTFMGLVGESMKRKKGLILNKYFFAKTYFKNNESLKQN